MIPLLPKGDWYVLRITLFSFIPTSVVYHPNTGHLAGIGKLPALAG